MKKICYTVVAVCFIIILISGSLAESSGVFGFDMQEDEFVSGLNDLLALEKEWTKETVPAKMDDFPFYPHVIFDLDEALIKVKTKLSHKGAVYTCVTDIKDLFEIAEIPFPKSHTDFIWFGGQQKSGGTIRGVVKESEPYTYVDDWTETLKIEKGAKPGTFMQLERKWSDHGRHHWISAYKPISNQNIATYWDQTIWYGITKGSLEIGWGCNKTKHTFFFNVRDQGEEKGCIVIYNTKTGKLTHFQRGGDLLVTVK